MRLTATWNWWPGRPVADLCPQQGPARAPRSESPYRARPRAPRPGPVDGRVSMADAVTAALDVVLEVPAVVLASAARDHRTKVVAAQRALSRSLEDTAGKATLADEGCAHQKDLPLGPNTLRARHGQP